MRPPPIPHTALPSQKSTGGPPAVAWKEPILNTQLAEILSAALLVLVLVGAVIRPFGWPEAVIAVPAAALPIATGAISWGDAVDEAEQLGPVIGFLAAVLVLAQLCDDEGLFKACGAWMARTAAGRPRRLLAQVFVAASAITAMLSLDATVVLLTQAGQHLEGGILNPGDQRVQSCLDESVSPTCLPIALARGDMAELFESVVAGHYGLLDRHLGERGPHIRRRCCHRVPRS